MSVCVPSLKEGEDQKEITIEPAQALEDVEPLPEDCYTRPINLPEGTTLSPPDPHSLLQTLTPVIHSFKHSLTPYPPLQ